MAAGGQGVRMIRRLGVTYLCATTLAALRTRRPSRQLRPSSVLPRLLFLSRCDDALGKSDRWGGDGGGKSLEFSRPVRRAPPAPTDAAAGHGAEHRGEDLADVFKALIDKALPFLASLQAELPRFDIILTRCPAHCRLRRQGSQRQLCRSRWPSK